MITCLLHGYGHTVLAIIRGKSQNISLLLLSVIAIHAEMLVCIIRPWELEFTFVLRPDWKSAYSIPLLVAVLQDRQTSS